MASDLYRPDPHQVLTALIKEGFRVYPCHSAMNAGQEPALVWTHAWMGPGFVSSPQESLRSVLKDAKKIFRMRYEKASSSEGYDAKHRFLRMAERFEEAQWVLEMQHQDNLRKMEAEIQVFYKDYFKEVDRSGQRLLGLGVGVTLLLLALSLIVAVSSGDAKRDGARLPEGPVFTGSLREAPLAEDVEASSPLPQNR